MIDFLILFLIASGLAMDCFAVSIATGFIHKEIKFFPAFKIAFAFAFFQALMPAIGWLFGISIERYVRDIDHWLAFVLLAGIGVKMIYESFKPAEKKKHYNPEKKRIILGLSIATSIDAFAIGVSFAFIYSNFLVYPLAVIGIITFLYSISGIFLGKKFGYLLGTRAEMIGGIVLIIIAVKILIEHLTGG